MNLKENDWDFGGSIKYLDCDGKGSYVAKIKLFNNMLVSAILNNELVRRGTRLSLGDRVRVRCPAIDKYKGTIYWHSEG